MMRADLALTDQQITSALAELRTLIAQRYPEAQFDVFHGEDPEGVYLRATVDVDDTDPVLDTVLDRLYVFQVEQALPIHVVTTVPMERVARVSRTPSASPDARAS